MIPFGLGVFGCDIRAIPTNLGFTLTLIVLHFGSLPTSPYRFGSLCVVSQHHLQMENVQDPTQRGCMDILNWRNIVRIFKNVLSSLDRAMDACCLDEEDYYVDRAPPPRRRRQHVPHVVPTERRGRHVHFADKPEVVFIPTRSELSDESATDP